MQSSSADHHQCTYLKTKHGKTRYIVDGPSSSVDHVIVFVCGISSHSYSYLHLMNAIAKILPNHSTTQYLRYDKYGRGLSSNPDIEHSADLFVDQLYELIDHLILKKKGEETNEKRPRITIIGFSMGGCLSVHFAAQYENLVDDLILFSPAGASWKLPFGSSLVRVPWLGSVVYGALHKASTDEQKIGTGLFDLNDSLVKDRMKYAVEMKSKEDANDSQVSSFVNSFTNFPLQGSDEQIGMVGKSKIRVSLIWSLFDLTVSSTECFPVYYDLLKKNDKSRFIILNNTRHMFFMEREQDTAQLIVNFLNDTSDNGSVHEKFNRTIANVTKQTEPNRSVMTKADDVMWEYFNQHEEYRKFIV